MFFKVKAKVKAKVKSCFSKGIVKSPVAHAASPSVYFTPKQEVQGAQEEILEPSTIVGCDDFNVPLIVPSCTNTEDSSSSTEYFSARIQSLIGSRSECGSAMEADIAASKDHWTELFQSSSDDSKSLAKKNSKAFRRLQREYGKMFFPDWEGSQMRLGRKVAEGGQAEIFEVEGDVFDYSGYFPGDPHGRYLAKVFKGGASLEDLLKQWPLLGMFRILQFQNMLRTAYMPHYSGAIYRGMLLQDGRFAFLMRKYWGDLRKLIDSRMQHNRGRAPPFEDDVPYRCMFHIAVGMAGLHRDDVLHRDLKAANVLVDADVAYSHMEQEAFDPLQDRKFLCKVADYESSVGIVGTGFWRAPEILLGVKNKEVLPSLFTPQSDVYSYAMTCYEILTGRLPFEEFRASDYNVVLSGRRPALPISIARWLKMLFKRCWHQNPSDRPTFDAILSIFLKNVESARSKVFLETRVYYWEYDDIGAVKS